jgi:phosphatidylglycerophosphate synthase
MLYGVSCLLDAIDGHAARMLGQTSRFGAVLDMITDRYINLLLHIFNALILILADVLLLLYSASSHLRILHMHYYFKPSSLWILALIMFICIGMCLVLDRI